MLLYFVCALIHFNMCNLFGEHINMHINAKVMYTSLLWSFPFQFCF